MNTHQAVRGRLLLVNLLALGAVLGVGCSGTGGSSVAFVRSDSPAIDNSWPTQMNIYAASFLSEAEVVGRLGFQGATRTTTLDFLNHYRYDSADGALELFFDDGLDKPFHALSYVRNAAPVPITAFEGWQEAATRAAAFVSRLTNLTPVIYVGTDTDAEIVKSLTQGFVVYLLVDRRMVLININVKVDATGVYQVDADETPASATPTRQFQARTRADVDALASQAGLGAPLAVPGLQDPIFYLFDHATTFELQPFFFFQNVHVVALDPAANPSVRP